MSSITVSKIFAGVGILFGIGSLIEIALGAPLPAIPLSILAFGSEFASYIHAETA
jgi:hypothetical protein